jgi:tRNA pseudouridine55 synthase
MYHGIVNVYKEKGFTSFDVVAKMRGICGQKKIGHTGTLDPDAEGVLPVCLGKATKVCDMLTDSDKIYRAVMLLGVQTDTQDTTGTILSTGDVSAITPEDVRHSVASFTGEIDQIPPMYSALKVNGKKLCDLARAGITVERKSRKITIYDITIESVNLPRVEMTVHCSKGTYIRTLCHDIGNQLGCGAAMESLVRIQAAGYRLEDAYKLEELQQMKEQGTLSDVIRPIDDVFASYPALCVTQEAEKLLCNGNALRKEQFLTVSGEHFGQPVRVYNREGKFSAIYQYSEEKHAFKPVKMFLEE